MRRSFAALLCALILAAGACGRDNPNPFLNQNITVPPRDADTLIFTSNNYGATPGLPREVFAVGAPGDPLQLTHCNNETRLCDAVEAVPSPDRKRIVERRIHADANGDGKIDETDGVSLELIDLTRGVEGELVSATRSVSGVDWSPTDDLLVYTAATTPGDEGLFTILPNGTSNQSIIAAAGQRVRRSRFDPTGFTVTFEQVDSDGKSRVYVLGSTGPVQVTTGGDGTAPLAGTPYVVGSDADPVYSPDGQEIAFRRLRALGNGSLGIWDVLAVKGSDGSVRSIVSGGSVYRGAPDWSSRGLAFTEVDEASGSASIVVVQQDGSGRTPMVTVSAALGNPRWLH
jgi:hypothetical protein